MDKLNITTPNGCVEKKLVYIKNPLKALHV